MASRGPILGIDLGTTNSCAAVMDGGEPRVLANAEGSRTTPSVVAYVGDEILVGEPARAQAGKDPAATVFAAKRLIGRKFADVGDLRRLLPYALVAADNGDAWVEVDGRRRSPSEVSAYLRDAATDALGEPVTRAIVTVPAYFDDAQRQATRDAGVIAGLHVERILSEPTAAALAYGHNRQLSQVIAVYDFGGFDPLLRTLRYDAPGAPELARTTCTTDRPAAGEISARAPWRSSCRMIRPRSGRSKYSRRSRAWLCTMTSPVSTASAHTASRAWACAAWKARFSATVMVS